MSLYDAVRDLPLEVEGYALDLLSLQARPDFLRKTTVIRLQGGGEEGIGEDVTIGLISMADDEGRFIAVSRSKIFNSFSAFAVILACDWSLRWPCLVEI